MTNTPSPDAVLPAGWLTYHAEPVTLHSGGRSHYLVDGAVLFAHEPTRELVLGHWESLLVGRRSSVAVIVGVPTGGTAWAEALASRVGCRAVSAGDPFDFPQRGLVVAVDDVVTTGNSLLSVPNAHRRVAVVKRTYLNGVSAWMTINLPLL
jgi:orotate phosphoribosyltransferase